MQRTGESGFEVLRNYRARLPLTKTFALIGALLTMLREIYLAITAPSHTSHR